MDRGELHSLLAEVDAELAREGKTARLYLVGGAAMALAYDAERTTHDVDALVVDGHGAVMKAARAVAERHGLLRSWLNEQASVYMPRTTDRRALVVYDGANLRVLAASVEHLLVMKARAARATDIADIRHLAALAGVASLDQLVELTERILPDDPLSDRSRKVLGEVFAG